VAKDRRISIEDAQMRHGRKTKRVRIDGYKRHVLTHLDTELVPAVGVTAANVAEAEVAEQITADLQAQQRTLAELDIDRAYLSSSLVRDRPGDLQVFCKAFPVRNGPRFAKPAFTLDFDKGLLTCPNSVTMPFVPGGKVQFPAQTCQSCPLRASAPPASGVAACRSTPTSGCWPSCAPPNRPPTGGPGCASGSRSSTPWPTSAAGRAIVPATSASARTCSTSAALRWSTTSTSSPVNPHQPSKPPEPDTYPAL
jgi:Transposase DDE domain